MMNRMAGHWLGRSLVWVAAAALSSACVDESPLGPATMDVAASGAADRLDAVALATEADTQDRIGQLEVCGELSVPAGSRPVFHAYATGVQNYRWDATGWTFIGPSATLYGDAEGRGRVGSHYGGPTWESISGSKVTGKILRRCTADADAVDWLLLDADHIGGVGVLDEATLIQRVNTVGGIAPATAGFLGEVRGVPYTAEYFFYAAGTEE